MLTEVTLTLDVPEGMEIDHTLIDIRGGVSHNGWEAQDTGLATYHIPIKRLPPATVTVELPRETAEWMSEIDFSAQREEHSYAVSQACRAALEAEATDA